MTTIIPYQELLGNYDRNTAHIAAAFIIPYQELLGNYDSGEAVKALDDIIPYQELLGNYDFAHGFAIITSIIPYQEPFVNNLTKISPAGLATACGVCYNLNLLSNLGF